MIELSYRGLSHTPAAAKRMRKLADEQMTERGRSGLSASGWSALMAIDWCEAHGKDWTLSHAIGGGYTVEIMK